ncbi:uncharacterized protein BDW43DRAFT_320424 [Aspergillus alliaceus]|uniref:uncharacterized protein n=1 Tax=Petromyces alliaceus TaxID=209559 RepID=UPI0012A4AD70|nr:uncharacterized protein BDW43DRAFT_320424 [Aspergillus alliaceus]KAB8238705.1 hypothetical protein BDW43DRAFT_320424 [Aspergillus alliaceus]
MALETPHPVANDARGSERNIEAQGAFASNLARCGEILDAKDGDLRKPHTNGQGLSVHTPVNQAGSNVTYAANAHLMNQALMEMKMVRFSDSFWFMMFVVIAPSVSNEAQFFFPGDKSSYLFISLHVSATAWPWILCIAGYVVGFAIAGNLLVGAIILIESVPASPSIFTYGAGGALGQHRPVGFYSCWVHRASSVLTHSSRAVASTHSSQSSASCRYASNKGWRYVCDIAAYYKRRTWLGEASFACVDSTIDATESRQQPHFRSLIFALRPADLPVLCLLWAITGIIFSLHKTSLSAYLAAAPNILSITPTTVTTNYLYGYYLSTALCAIPGPILAGILIQTKLLGRKHTGAVIAVLTSLFMLLATLAVQLGRGLFGLVSIDITFAECELAGGTAVWFCGVRWVVIGDVD